MNCPLPLLKECFLTSLSEIGITSMFIHLLVKINKSSLEDWKLCSHNKGCPGKADSVISDIVEMKEMDDISIDCHIKTRWVDLYPQNDTRDDSDLQLLCFSLHICMID